MNYHEYLQKFFRATKVQKLSVNVGFSCPNRDGTIGFGGCIYCRNDSFSPGYCMSGAPLNEQIKRGKSFFSRKYRGMKYLVYFQSYTNTYTTDLKRLKSLYEEALEDEDVVGLVIGTRPDTLSPEIINILGDINLTYPVFVEIGAETSSDATLQLINRGHTWKQVVAATEALAARHLHVGLHLIAGLPGEDDNDVLNNVSEACKLPIETLKVHQLQILKDTPLYWKWINGEITVAPYELDEYLSLCVRIRKIVPPEIVIERYLAQSPPELVVAPKWGLKNYQFMNILNNRLKHE